MKRSILVRRSVAVPSALALMLAGLAVASAPASAEPVGTVVFNSLDSAFDSQLDSWSVTTSAACPSPATNFQIELAGPGIGAYPDNIITGNAAGSTVGGVGDGPFTAPASLSLSGFATAKALNVVDGVGYLAAGTYTASVRCRTALAQASLGEFTGQFSVTGSGAASVVAPVVVVVAEDTSTALTTSPLDDASWGAPVTLTATVTNDNPSGDVPAGTVLFKDDGVAVGSTVAVNGSGVATTTVFDLDLGDNAITAEFTGGDGFNDSATLAATTVTVALSGPTNVRPATLSGSVKVGGTVVCNAGTWSGATSYTYEFLKNGVVAQGPGSDFDLVLSAADYNKTLSCRVRGVNPEGSATSTTTAPKVALGSAAVATKAPRILYSGTAANVGETLKAFKGTWSPTATYTYNYIWKRGTTTIKQGSTATSYKATTLDRGKKLTLIVQVKRTGYATATKTSAAVVVK